MQWNSALPLSTVIAEILKSKQDLVPGLARDWLLPCKLCPSTHLAILDPNGPEFSAVIVSEVLGLSTVAGAVELPREVEDTGIEVGEVVVVPG